MRRLSIESFTRQLARYDGLVARTEGIDRFCSSSPWTLPALVAFHAEAEPFVLGGAKGYAPLAITTTPLGRTVTAFEAVWGLSACLVGRDLVTLADELAEVLHARSALWDALLFTGHAPGSPALRRLMRRFSKRHDVLMGRPTLRCAASLEGGWDGYVSRRTRNWRRSLQRSEERAAERGVRFEVLAPDEPDAARALFSRVLAVERRSWKGIRREGIQDGPMRDFYALMAPRLAARGALRLTLARLGAREVGFVLGGVFAGEYRGLQMSFDEDLRELSLGNVMQAVTIRALCEEGVGLYDLGTDREYKRRWAEERITTASVVVMPEGLSLRG